MNWKNQLTKTPVFIFFILLGGIGVGTASAAITITLAGDVVVTDSITADEYFDSGNTQTGTDATALGGVGNLASAFLSTVSGGGSNTASGSWSTVGGGENNTAGTSATVAGGTSNNADALRSTVGGGFSNNANETHSTIGGGSSNTASGFWATVGGGDSNTASGQRSTIPGGDRNQATGDYSFATGRQAMALHDGAIVFADSNGFDFSSNGINELSIRATGGARIVTDIDGSGNPTESVSFLPGGKIQLTGGTLAPGKVLISEDSSGTGTWGDPPSSNGIPGALGIYTREIIFDGFSTGDNNIGLAIACDLEDFALSGGVADDNAGTPDEFVVKEFGNGEVENFGSNLWIVTVDFKSDSIGGLGITLHVVCLDFSPAHI